MISTPPYSSFFIYCPYFKLSFYSLSVNNQYVDLWSDACHDTVAETTVSGVEQVKVIYLLTDIKVKFRDGNQQNRFFRNTHTFSRE